MKNSSTILLRDKKSTGGSQMSQSNNNIQDRKGKHLNYEERIKIEALHKVRLKSSEKGDAS
jgi:hypothetical protein